MASDVPGWILPAASIFSALLSAIVVAAGNYAVQRWRYRTDRLSAAVDHLCEEINSAADMSTRYWLLDTSQNDDNKRAKELEPELVGRQMRLQSLMLALRSFDSAVELYPSDGILVSLFEAMTGGDFRVAGRKQDGDKAQLVQSLAAQLNGELRRSVAARSRKFV